MDVAVAMAPPSKRRKLADSPSDSSTSISDNSTISPESSPSFAHGVESLPTHSGTAPPYTTSSGSTEQATRIPFPAVGGIEDFNVLVARQGTLLNSVDSAINSVISSVTSVISASESISISISASVSIPDPLAAGTSTTTDTASTSSTSSAESSISSGSTSSNASTSSTDSSSITSAPTPTGSYPSESSPSDLSNSSSTISTPTGNGTSNSVTASTSSTTGLSALSANLTTSALGSATSSRTTSSSRTGSSTSTDSGLYFFATLSDGEVSAISRHSGAYTTTFSDGEVFTIPGISASSTRSSSRTASASDMSTTTIIETTSVSASSSDNGVSTVTAIATVGGAGNADGSSTYAAPATSSTSSSDGGGGNNDNTPPAGTIAGGVVGGAAGLAVVVLIAMLFVRWYRRKGQMSHQALPPGSVDSPDGDGAGESSRGMGMAERAGLMPAMAALPAFFRHQNRSTEGSQSTERGFTRVSGRKLPSAFSEGMTSEGMSRGPPPQMPLRSPGPDSTLHEQSFYRDSEGFYGGAREAPRSISPASDDPFNGGQEVMTMSPGPQRQPQIHSGGPYAMSPTTSDIPTSASGTAATFGRSETPVSLRNSRFTEDM